MLLTVIKLFYIFFFQLAWKILGISWKTLPLFITFTRVRSTQSYQISFTQSYQVSCKLNHLRKLLYLFENRNNIPGLKQLITNLIIYTLICFLYRVKQGIKALRGTHKERVHNLVIPEQELSNKYVADHDLFNYSKAHFSLVLLLMNADDAMKEGDGERLQRVLGVLTFSRLPETASTPIPASD